MLSWPTLMTFQLTNNSKSLIILGTRYPQLNYLIIMFLNPFFKKKIGTVSSTTECSNFNYSL